jgi:hypothetical protein
MAAYLGGRHHPREALPPRTAFVALSGGAVELEKHGLVWPDVRTLLARQA